MVEDIKWTWSGYVGLALLICGIISQAVLMVYLILNILKLV